MSEMIDSAFVQKADQTEWHLIETARDAANSGNWIVGECACRWLHTYAKGRTDEAFGDMIGLSKVQVFQRRRVWEEFGEIYSALLNLTWTHFREAMQWDDAEDCLRWANDCEATVSEMRAWRRAQRGEDLFADTTEADDPGESDPDGNSGFRKNTEETSKQNTPSPVEGTTRAASSAATGKAERAKVGDKGNPESPSRPVTEFHEEEDEEPDPIDEWLAARTLEDVVRAWFEYPDDLQPAAQHLRKLADRLDPPN